MFYLQAYQNIQSGEMDVGAILIINYEDSLYNQNFWISKTNESS